MAAKLLSPPTSSASCRRWSRRQVDGLIRLMGQRDYGNGHQPMPTLVPTVSVLHPVAGADVVSVDHFGSARALGLPLARARSGIVAYVGLAEPIGYARYHGLRCGMEEMGVRLPNALICLCKEIE